jgi:hypothetical protein
MKFDNRVPTLRGYPAIGNLGIEALAGPSRMKAFINQLLPDLIVKFH